VLYLQEGQMTTIVIDLDGTLANCEHRQQHAQNGDWAMFHSLLSDDQPHVDVVWFLEAISWAPLTPNIIALTGRNERYREATMKWFRECGIHQIDLLVMRPDDDYTSDHILKPRMLQDQFASKDEMMAEVLFILEDRDKVVDAWREIGFNCWQVRQGTF
jgi:hypothetical protein